MSRGRDAVRAGRLGRSAARLPLGHAGRGEGRAQAPSRTASSTCRSARRSTRRPEIGRQALAGRPNSPGYPLTSGTPAAAARRSPATWPSAGAPSVSAPERDAAGDRHQGAGGLAADPARPRARRPGRLSRPGLPDVRGRGAGSPAVAAVACDDLAELGRRAAGPGLAELPVQPDRPDPAAAELPPTGRPGPGSAARWSPPTSATASSAGTPSRSRCCTRGSAAATIDGLLAVHSLSKRSNLAGYRAGFVAGDAGLVAELLAVRKHAGMIVPRPVQEAMIARCSADQEHVSEQRDALLSPRGRCCGRRWRRAGFTDRALRGLALPVGHPRRGRPGRRSTAWPSAASWSPPATSTARPRAAHVRVALTATDERVAAAATRLTSDLSA